MRCGRVWAVFREGGSGVSCGAGVDGGAVVLVLGVRKRKGGCVVGGMNGMGGVLTGCGRVNGMMGKIEQQ